MDSRAQLAGWKAIAAHFRRDERTVMRWAATRGMPVRRVPGQAGRSTVYADKSALDAWLKGIQGAEAIEASDPDLTITPPASASAAPPPLRLAEAPPAPVQHPWRRWRAPLAAAAMLALVVAGATGWRWNGGGAAAASGAHRALPEDPAAKANYLQATYDWNLRTADSLTRAVAEFGAAIARDPRYAPAYVGLANAYLLLREFGSLPDAEAYSRAAAAADAALALDPDSPDAHRALAFVAFWGHGDRETARREFAEAIRRNPGDPLTHHWFATALASNGEPKAALDEIAIARQLDPTSTSLMVDYGLVRFMAGDRDGALRTLGAMERSGSATADVHRSLATIYLQDGRLADYLAESRAMAVQRGDADAVRSADALMLRYRQGGRAALLDAMAQQARAEDRSGYALARILSLANRREEALGTLARACRIDPVVAARAPGDTMLSHFVGGQNVRRICGSGTLLI